jgi:hypothetical protein
LILGGGLSLYSLFTAFPFPLTPLSGGGLLESLLRRGGGLSLTSLALPFPLDGGGLVDARLRLGGGLLESRRRRGGGDGERDGDVEYFRLRRGGGERDMEPDGLRPRRVDLPFGGGERDRDTEDEELRPRFLGAGERDREREDE